MVSPLYSFFCSFLVLLFFGQKRVEAKEKESVVKKEYNKKPTEKVEAISSERIGAQVLSISIGVFLCTAGYYVLNKSGTSVKINKNYVIFKNHPLLAVLLHAIFTGFFSFYLNLGIEKYLAKKIIDEQRTPKWFLYKTRSYLIAFFLSSCSTMPLSYHFLGEKGFYQDRMRKSWKAPEDIWPMLLGVSFIGGVLQPFLSSVVYKVILYFFT